MTRSLGGHREATLFTIGGPTQGPGIYPGPVCIPGGLAGRGFGEDTCPEICPGSVVIGSGGHRDISGKL